MFHFHNKLDHTNIFSSNGETQLISKHQGNIFSLYNGEDDNGYFMVLSPFDYFQIVIFNDSKWKHTP
jgi:hypothetical protein